MPSNNSYAAIFFVCIRGIVCFSRVIFTIAASFGYFFRYGFTAKRFGYFPGDGDTMGSK